MNKKDRKTKGFTLMELLVSIAIFTIITVLMSNIVITTTKFALDTERRNDFIAELDNAANIVKNDLRSAQEVKTNVCSGNRIFRKTVSASTTRYYMLTTESNRLVWIEKSDTCTDLTSPARLYVTTAEVIKIDSTNPNSLKVSMIKDSKDSSRVSNSLSYVTVTACNSDNVPASSRVFDCSVNPYKYVFAISTRNIY